MAADGVLCDPLANLDVTIQNYDVPRFASIYADKVGGRWWTKAYFNGREKGERSVEISEDMAEHFNQDEISLDEWLARFFPKQLNSCIQAIASTRRQLLD